MSSVTDNIQSSKLYYQRGLNYAKLKQYDKVVEDLCISIEKDTLRSPQKLDCHYNLAIAFLMLNRWDEVKIYFPYINLSFI